MISGRRSVWLVYAVLVALRLGVSLTSQSVIHPDEHFQNPELAARLVLDYTTSASQGPLSTWEWDSVFPCRSIVPVWATTATAFSILARSNSELSR